MAIKHTGWACPHRNVQKVSTTHWISIMKKNDNFINTMLTWIDAEIVTFGVNKTLNVFKTLNILSNEEGLCKLAIMW